MSLLSNKDIEKLSANYGEDFTPDVDRGLAALHERMRSAPAAPPVRQLRPLRRWLAIAASLLVLFAVALWMFTDDGSQTIANEGVEPLNYTLPDGTEVVLQQGTTLTFAEDFNQTDRRLDLDGQAYFEVVPDQARPFMVSNGESELRVTGTAFNLRVKGEDMEVEVSEGSVMLMRDDEKMPVSANTCGIARAGESLQVMQAPRLNRHAWRTGVLDFKDTPVDEVLACFRSNWGIDAYFVSPEGCDYPVTAKFSGGDAGAALKDIAKLGGASFRSIGDEGKTFELSGPCSR